MHGCIPPLGVVVAGLALFASLESFSVERHGWWTRMKHSPQSIGSRSSSSLSATEMLQKKSKNFALFQINGVLAAEVTRLTESPRGGTVCILILHPSTLHPTHRSATNDTIELLRPTIPPTAGSWCGRLGG